MSVRFNGRTEAGDGNKKFKFYFIFLFSLLIFTVWFTSIPVGHNKLGNVVSKMCKDADLEGQFSNHSLRAITATRGLEKGILDKLIMERTGHRDIRSLQRYQMSLPKLRFLKH